MQRLALVWPPINTSHYGGKQALRAYMAWFFGDVFDAIHVPLSRCDNTENTQHFSLGSLVNAHKVHLFNKSDVPNTEYSTILVTDQSMSYLPLQIASCKKLPGSRPCAIKSEPNASAHYYYIGSPTTEKDDAYLCVTYHFWASGGVDQEQLSAYKDRLKAIKQELDQLRSVVVFGTGPSLSEVDPQDYAGDNAIICNTIVKNRPFCNMLNVKLVVASDCHFHFSSNRYSFQFISDLAAFLRNSCAKFVTFDKFVPFLLKKNIISDHRIIGIPAGREAYGFDFDDDFRVYAGESVVNMFLLPLACYFSKDVKLCGFTGRAPSDNYFWSHADKFQYQDLLPSVRGTHPAFFSNRDYDAYAATVGEQLSDRIKRSRDAGIKIQSMTTSFYKGIEKV